MSSVLRPHPEGGRYWAAALSMSAILHIGVAVYALGVISFDAVNDTPPMSFPDIAISNTVLEQQQLAALSAEEAALAASDNLDEVPPEEAVQPEAEQLAAVDQQAEALAQAEAEALAQAEAEELEQVEAEDLGQVEAEELEQVEAEELDQVEAEELAALEPEALDALEPVEPEQAVVAEDVSPILPETPDADAASPVPASPALIPITPENTNSSTIQGATLTAVAPAVVAAAPVVSSIQPVVTSVTPVAPLPRPAAPPVPTPTPAALPPPSPEDLAVLELIQRIKARFGDECLIALPQNQGAGLNPLVTIISDQERSMAAFVSDVLSDPNQSVDERRILVDSRQCAVLDYARAHRNYPAFRIDLTLQSRVIGDGNNIRGRISGIGGRYTSLLAVDSNGVVTDLRRFTQFRQGTADLDAPVNVNGAPRDTSHLLIAIATPGLPSVVAQRAGWLAEDFFPLLREETDGRSALAILPFDVR